MPLQRRADRATESRCRSRSACIDAGRTRTSADRSRRTAARARGMESLRAASGWGATCRCREMRLGIRVQLLLALGSLLVLAFVPLFFAVASLTRATMTSAREASARALGRAVAGHVTAAGEGRSAE